MVAQRNGLGDRGMHSVGAFRFSPPGAHEAAPPIAGATYPEPSAGNPGSADNTGMMTSVHTVIDTTLPM